MPTARDFWSLAPAVLALHVLALWGLQILLASHTLPTPSHIVDVRLLSPQHRQADGGADFAIVARGTSRRPPHRRRETTQEGRRADAPQGLARATPSLPASLAQHAPQPRPANPAPSAQRASAAPSSPSPLRGASAAIRSDPLDRVRQAPSEAPFPAVNGVSAAHPQHPVHPSTAATVMTPPNFGASYLHNPKPVYPALARRLGEEGEVVLQVRVLANGRADSVSIRHTSGYPELDQAALAAVRQWTFTPASSAGRPVAGWVLVPILFSLDAPAD